MTKFKMLLVSVLGLLVGAVVAFGSAMAQDPEPLPIDVEDIEDVEVCPPCPPCAQPPPGLVPDAVKKAFEAIQAAEEVQPDAEQP